MRLLTVITWIWDYLGYIYIISSYRYKLFVGLLLLSGPLICFNRKKSKAKCIQEELILQYILLIFVVAVISRSPVLEYQYSVIPLWSYFEMFSGSYLYMREIISNVIFFMPLGLLCRLRKKEKLKKILLFGIIVSGSVELSQLLLKRGMCEFDDIISNTAGTLIGYSICSGLITLGKGMLKMDFFRILRLRIRLIKKLLTYYVRVRNVDAILVNTPNHKNLGDQAITLAEIDFLTKQRIRFVELTAQELERKIHVYAKLTPRNKTVLVHGGGYLGNIWEKEEKCFRAILRQFSKQKIITFPQTVTFDLSTTGGRAFFQESKRIYEEHTDLTVFVREKNSYDFLSSQMRNVSVHLVPDIVLSYEPRVQKCMERNGILMCMRSDKEKLLTETEVAQIEQYITSKYPGKTIRYTDTVIKDNVYINTRETEVNKKLLEFASASLVITDRLHGMIFSALTGTPCVAFGNSNGKVNGVFEWITSNPYVIYIDDIKNFEKVLDSLRLDIEYVFDHQGIGKQFAELSETLSRISRGKK